MKLFMGSIEQEQYLHKQNSQIKHARVKEIRRQDADLTKKQIAVKKEHLRKQQEEQEKERKYQEYLQKLALIEELNRQKEQSIIEIGKAQREAELFKQRQAQEQAKKAEREAYFKEQAIKRFVEAQDWTKQQFLATDVGRSMQLANQRKESQLQEKTREQQTLLLYREQNKSRSTLPPQPELESYEKFDKNISRRQILRPEDFAHTCFHNPQVVKNESDSEQENAMERANQTMIETQTELLEKARQQREAERAQKERSKKALDKVQQSKVLEQLEQESRFLKKKEAQELQKTRPPVRKLEKTKEKQNILTSAFNEMFGNKLEKGAVIEVKSHQAKSNSPRRKSALKDKATRPKSVKVFTKAPLDTNLYNDYSNYALGSPEQSERKKKVQFHDSSAENQQPKIQPRNSMDLEEVSLPGPEAKPSQLIKVRDQSHSAQAASDEEQEQFLEHDEDDDKELQHSEFKEQSSTSELSSKKESEMHISDLRQYVQQQEQYLEKLEQQRINLKSQAQQMNQEDQKNLMNNFKATRQFFKHTIPEESEEESELKSQEKSFNQSEVRSSPMKQSETCTQPLTSLLKSQQFDTIDNLDSNDIMQQFLRPRKTREQEFLEFKQQQELLQQQIREQQQLLQRPQEPQYFTSQKMSLSASEQPQFKTIESAEAQAQLLSPGSELNYSLSDAKKDALSSIKPPAEELEPEASLGETLGDIFQKRKAQLAKRLEERQEQIEHTRTVEKGGKTKEELIAIRREMMKRPRKPAEDEAEAPKQQPQVDVAVEDKRSQLMKRLATGEKVKVERKEMLELTSKNFEKLPEVQKKKLEQERSESLKQRKQKVKEMDQRLRESLKQKRGE